jgi:hypothetical protein
MSSYSLQFTSQYKLFGLLVLNEEFSGQEMDSVTAWNMITSQLAVNVQRSETFWCITVSGWF